MLEESKKLLNRGTIGEALSQIAEKTKALFFEGIPEKAERLLYDYNIMLNYFATGGEDPSRQDMLAKVVDRAYHLIDLTNFIQDTEKLMLLPLSEADTNNPDELFDAIENNFPATKEDRAIIRRLILDESLPLYLRGMVLSALTLNLLKYFDNEKFESLYTYTLEDQPLVIRQRAWVAIVLVTMAHDDRISSQPRLVEQMNFICEEGTNDENQNILLVIQYALYQCIQARKTRSIIMNDIAPEIEEGIKKVKEQTDDEDELAPRWEEYMEKSGIQEKIQNFIELQRKGVDIMYESFKHLCHTKFFTRKCNWLMPFDIDFPDVKRLIQGNEIRENYFKIIAKARNMCSTDKYSNISMFSFLPDSQLSQIETQLKANGVKVENVMDASPEDEVLSYMHDLYRYYTIFNKKKDYNPFEQTLYFGMHNNLKAVVKSSHSKHLLADLLLKNEEWAEASYVLDDLAKTEESEEVLQKLAYSIYKVDDKYSESINILARCNYLYPNNKWTIKHYAEALSSFYEFEAEEIVLRNAIDQFPEDVSFIVMLGRNLTNQERYQEAVEQLFKADLMKENSYRTTSCLADAAFYLGNKELAEKYIKKTLASPKAEDEDWIYGGHIALLSGNIPLALERYREADQETIEEHLEDGVDKRVLVELGVPKEVVTLTFEVIKRENKEK